MRRRTALVETFHVLALGAALAAVGLAGNRLLRPAPTPEPIPPALDPPGLEAEPVHSRASLDSIIDLNPLHPQRRRIERPSFLPEAAMSLETAEAPRMQLQDIQLVGTTILGGASNLALIRENGQAARIVRVGDTIGGTFFVKAVERAALLLVDEDSTFTLHLTKPW